MDGVTRLFIIRHGHTVNGDEMRYKGHTDVPLSDRGRMQAERLGRWLAGQGEKPQVFLSSDLSRAVETASIIGDIMGVVPEIEPDLRERSFGKWEGMSFEEIASAWPEEFERWKADPLNYSPPEGESTVSVRERVSGLLERRMAEFRGRDVFIVSHGGVNRVLLAGFMGLSLGHIFRIEQDYCCLNIVKVFPDGFSLVSLLNGHPS